MTAPERSLSAEPNALATALATALTRAAATQIMAVAQWHAKEPDALELERMEATLPKVPSPEQLERLALLQHHENFQLWHTEDTARRTDVGPEVIAECKRMIDAFNQRRNDRIERLDACLVALIEPLVPKDAPRRHNTETLGSVLDRLSILALKMYHMAEEAEREDASARHRKACAGKLGVMAEQHRDLLAAAIELVGDYAQGLKRPKVYFQFKMYNDPALNPELYRHAEKP